MAGVKGRSGGARPGSGQKAEKLAISTPSEGQSTDDQTPETPLEFMLRVMNDPAQSVTVRSRMAITAAQYVHTKSHDGGKKNAKLSAADKVSQGKFATAAAPRLAVVKR